MTDAVPPVRFLPPAYANDSDAIDDDLFMMHCESVCPLADWLSSRRLCGGRVECPPMSDSGQRPATASFFARTHNHMIPFFSVTEGQRHAA
jgi:hypothetical protein